MKFIASLIREAKFRYHSWRFERLRARHAAMLRRNAPPRLAHQQGYSLIELAVVVAIIGIILSFALPAFSAQVAKNQAGEALRMLDSQETSVAEAFMANGVGCGNAAECGISQTPGRYVASIDAGSGGALYATFKPDAPNGLASTILTLVPYTTSADPSSGILWVCGNSPIPAGAVPLPVGTANAVPTTTVPDKLLPKACHA